MIIMDAEIIMGNGERVSATLEGIVKPVVWFKYAVLFIGAHMIVWSCRLSNPEGGADE